MEADATNLDVLLVITFTSTGGSVINDFFKRDLMFDGFAPASFAM